MKKSTSKTPITQFNHYYQGNLTLPNPTDFGKFSFHVMYFDPRSGTTSLSDQVQLHLTYQQAIANVETYILKNYPKYRGYYSVNCYRYIPE